MPVLEIHFPAGRTELREISREAPLIVGRMPQCDIRIDEDGIAPIQCRISWNRGNFEVTAVAPEGIEWNGVLVQQALFSPGDAIRIGEVEIVMQTEAGRSAKPPKPPRNPPPSPAPPKKRQPQSAYEVRSFRPAEEDDVGARHAGDEPSEELFKSAELDLKPVTQDELPVRSFHFSEHLSKDAGPQAGPAPEPEESAGERRSGMSRVAEVALDLDALVKDEAVSKEVPVLLRNPNPKQKEGLFQAATRIKDTMRSPPRRPGEQELLRSPLVVGLGIGTLVLALAAVSIWFVLSREAAQREYDAARALLDSGQFGLAIEAFEQFLKNRPRHGLVEDARLAIATAKIEQPIASAVPDWRAGLDSLNQFVDEHREKEVFQDPKSTLRKLVLQFSDKIAMGAAETARTMRKRTFLPVSAEASRLLEVYSPSDAQPTERLQEISAKVKAAELAIVQQEAFDVVAQKFDTALSDDAPLAALPEYRRLLDRYPGASDYKPLQERLKKSFELERRRTARDETRREAERTERSERAVPGLTLARRVRARSDSLSVGTIVLAWAADSLYGVDAVTGEPLWRRVIGLDPPFAPTEIAASVAAVLTYDSRTRDLVLLAQKTGDLLWRLPLEAPPQGAPLVLEGQILLATEGGMLEQIDLNSGAATARLRFSQGLIGPPVPSLSGERLYVPGHADLLYVLKRRPLGCEQVVWTGHGPGSIVAPPLMMRSYLLLAENDQVERARVRLFDTTAEEGPPRQIAVERIDGQVRDLPAVRGKQLVVPSSPERLAAFTVAETGDRQSLSVIGNYQVKDPTGAPMFVSVGADDQLWMTSTALRRFTISRDALLPEKQELAVGIATQPLQIVGDSLYVGRRQAFSRAILFSEVDRLRMSAQWQTTLGATVLECTAPSAEGSTLCVTLQGDLFQISPSRLGRAGFETQSLGQVSIPEGHSDSLAAVRLSDGRLAIYCSGPQSRVWLTGSDGTIREYKLPAALEAAPIALGPGLLVPLAGRLRLFNRNTDSRIAEDLPAEVTDSEAARWRSVAAVDETHALALNVAGRLARVQFRTAPVAHLAEVTHWDAGRPVDQPLAVSGNRVLITDTCGRIVLLDASSFEPLAEATLPQPAVRAPVLAGDRVFVEIADGSLLCLDADRQLAVAWDLSLEGASVVGAPLNHEGDWLIALSDGRVLTVSPADGAIRRTLTLSQRLALGPQRWGQQIVVGTLDGTLLVLTNRLAGEGLQ